jgi:hypothetical protein
MYVARLQDLEAVAGGGAAHVDGAVEAARPQQRLVQQRQPVGRADDLRAPARALRALARAGARWFTPPARSRRQPAGARARAQGPRQGRVKRFTPPARTRRTDAAACLRAQGRPSALGRGCTARGLTDIRHPVHHCHMLDGGRRSAQRRKLLRPGGAASPSGECGAAS